MADLQSMLRSLSQSYPPIVRLLQAGSYFTGMALISKAIFNLKQYGEMRVMMSAHTDIRGPLVLIFVGAMLLFLPTTMDVLLLSTFGDSSILAYDVSSSVVGGQLLLDILNFIRIVGFIAFVRGWWIMTALGSSHAPPGTLTKALVHLVGGILAINIVGTMKIIAGTFGLDIDISVS